MSALYQIRSWLDADVEHASQASECLAHCRFKAKSKSDKNDLVAVHESARRLQQIQTEAS